MNKTPLCIAHRGGPGPENSLEAIEHSLALGIEALEIDIWQLRGQLWVTHDHRLGRQLSGPALYPQVAPQRATKGSAARRMFEGIVGLCRKHATPRMAPWRLARREPPNVPSAALPLLKRGPLFPANGALPRTHWGALRGDLWVKGRASEGRLDRLSMEALEALQLSNGEPLPRLHQVLELVGDRALLNIEIKGPNTAVYLAETLRAHCREHQLSHQQYLVSSFDHWQLYQMLELMPSIRRAALIAENPLDYARCCEELKAWGLCSNLGFTSRELVVDAHARGLHNWVYTANYPDEWQDLLALGVDGIFTDEPEALQSFLAKTGEAP